MTRFTLVAPLLLASLALIITSCAPLVVAGAGTAGVAVAQERTVGTAVDDAAIHTKIWNNYLQSGTNNIYSDVGIEVNEGVVLLTGPVATPDTAAKAVQLAWEVEGVREVINEIQITDRGGPNMFAKDTWITTQAKSRLIAEKGVKSVNYTIETVNGVIYVMGIAQNDDELARVLNVLSRVKGVKRVVSHVRAKTDPRRPQPANPNAMQPAPVESNSY